MKNALELLDSLNREWNRIDGALERLNNFMFSDEFEALPDITKINLEAQANVMAAYSRILRARMMEHDFHPSFHKEWRE